MIVDLQTSERSRELGMELEDGSLRGRVIPGPMKTHGDFIEQSFRPMGVDRIHLCG